MKKCPYCAEEIQEAAVLCKHCGRTLSGAHLVQSKQVPIRKTDYKKLGKIVGIIVLLLLSFSFWYITIPAALLWYLWRTKRLSRKNKSITAAATVVIFIILGSVSAYAGRQPTITITDPEGGASVQADTITVNGTVDPQKSTVTVQGNKVAVNDNGAFTYEARLSNGSNNVAIEAKNGSKSAKASVIVIRNLTEAEKAEQERLVQEQAQAEAEQKQRQEAEAGVKAEADEKATAERQAERDARKTFNDKRGNNAEAAATAEALESILTLAGMEKGSIDLYAEISAPDEATKKYEEGGDKKEYRSAVTTVRLIAVVRNSVWTFSSDSTKKDLVVSFVRALKVDYPDAIPSVIVNNGIRTVAEGSWSIWSGEPKVDLK